MADSRDRGQVLKLVRTGLICGMKFILAWLVTLGMAVVLGLGILLAVQGRWWLLSVGVLAYLIAFARIGCSQGASH